MVRCIFALAGMLVCLAITMEALPLTEDTDETLQEDDAHEIVKRSVYYGKASSNKPSRGYGYGDENHGGYGNRRSGSPFGRSGNRGVSSYGGSRKDFGGYLGQDSYGRFGRGKKYRGSYGVHKNQGGYGRSDFDYKGSYGRLDFSNKGSYGHSNFGSKGSYGRFNFGNKGSYGRSDFGNKGSYGRYNFGKKSSYGGKAYGVYRHKNTFSSPYNYNGIY